MRTMDKQTVIRIPVFRTLIIIILILVIILAQILIIRVVEDHIFNACLDEVLKGRS